MSLKAQRHAAKRDKDEPRIIQAFQECGHRLVTRLSEAGCPDLLMATRNGDLYLVECKTKHNKQKDPLPLLTTLQKEWLDQARAFRWPVYICLGESPVLDIVNHVEKRYRRPRELVSRLDNV